MANTSKLVEILPSIIKYTFSVPKNHPFTVLSLLTCLSSIFQLIKTWLPKTNMRPCLAPS